jgi:hypothetical protein
MESVNDVINVPLRRAEGSKLSPTYTIVEKDTFTHALASVAANKNQPLIFVGDDSPDERAQIAAQYALSARYEDVSIVLDSVPQWLKKFTASGKPKKVLARGAYKSDLLSKGAFNMFAGES